MKSEKSKRILIRVVLMKKVNLRKVGMKKILKKWKRKKKTDRKRKKKMKKRKSKTVMTRNLKGYMEEIITKKFQWKTLVKKKINILRKKEIKR